MCMKFIFAAIVKWLCSFIIKCEGTGAWLYFWLKCRVIQASCVVLLVPEEQSKVILPGDKCRLPGNLSF